MLELTVLNVSLTLLAAITLSRAQKLYNGIRATGGIPGFRIPFQPYAFPGGFFKTYWWNLGVMGIWHWRNSLYKRFGRDTVSVVPIISGIPSVITANLDVARQVMAGLHKTSYGKTDLKGARLMSFWGVSLVLAEGDDWRRHRRIVGPAFGNKLYALVWRDSLDLYNQMIQIEFPTNQSAVEVSAVQDLTFKFAFYIIGRCGFDFPFMWEKGKHQEGEGEVPFAEAMRFFIENIEVLHLPKGALDKVPVSKARNRFKEMNECVSQLRKFMDSKIAQKESNILHKDLGDDIFSMLVQANQAEGDSKLKLNYQELISNVFLMLFAGHETTAHTLAATIACLAAYPEQQLELVDQIMSVLDNDTQRDPTFDDYPKLNKVQAAFYEALRMFPTAYITMRQAYEDTVLKVPVSLDSDDTATFAIEKGTHSTDRNPRYFDDPNTYRISRWEGISNESEAIAAFGIGPRACIGRKFALSEAVCFLTLVLRDWKLEPMLSKGQSVDEWFGEIEQCNALLTLGVGKVPVRFVKRT